MYLCILTKAHCILFEQTHIEDGLRVPWIQKMRLMFPIIDVLAVPQSLHLKNVGGPVRTSRLSQKKETVLIDDWQPAPFFRYVM